MPKIICAAVFGLLSLPGIACAQDNWPSAALGHGFNIPSNHFYQGQSNTFNSRQAAQDEQVRQWGNTMTGNATVCVDGYGQRYAAGSGYCPQGTRPLR
jgi:hypothetical protein